MLHFQLVEEEEKLASLPGEAANRDRVHIGFAGRAFERYSSAGVAEQRSLHNLIHGFANVESPETGLQSTSGFFSGW